MKKFKTLILVGILGTFMATAAGCELATFWNASHNGEQNTVLEHTVPEQTKTYANNADILGKNSLGQPNASQNMTTNVGDRRNMPNDSQNQTGSGMATAQLSREDREMIRYFMRNFNNGTYTNISDPQRQMLNTEYNSIRTNRNAMRSSDVNNRSQYESLINGSYNNILNYARDYYKTNNIDYNALRSGRNNTANNTINNNASNVPNPANNVNSINPNTGSVNNTVVNNGNSLNRSSGIQGNAHNDVTRATEYPIQIPSVNNISQPMNTATGNMPNVSGANQSIPSDRL